ncbi:HD domain-containing phosphohydrolase [Hippea alviniae]|uniref:HD domain-containing phosphohydrolase n=1 Tax=Hippea alviniae TaxID=1279027 RepID=UPI0012DC5687|nr:HD domain-containing phosphohydrolase [Hippea alviniae]
MRKLSEKSYFRFVYAILIIIFLLMVSVFYFTEKTQKSVVERFVYQKEIDKQKEAIKLETYAVISFIDSYTNSIIKDTFKTLSYELSLKKPLFNPDNITESLNRLNQSGEVKFAVFFDNGSSTADFLSFKYCKPYRKNLNLSFNKIHLYMCKSPTLKEGVYPQKFLVATTQINNLKLAAYTSMLNLEVKIMDFVFPRLNEFIFQNKNRDSYFFVVKILNLNGGKDFAMNIYNKSLGVDIGKPSSSFKPDAKGNYYREKYLKGLREHSETYSTYWYPSPTSRKPQLKISFRKYYEPLHWMVGTGFYVHRLKEEAALFSDNLFKKLRLFQILLFLLYLITLLVIYLIGRDFSKTVQRDTNKIVSAIPFIGKKRDPINLEEISFEKLKTISDALNSLSSTIIDKNLQLEQNRLEFIKAFVKVVEVRDVYTKGHSERVALYSQRIAAKLGLNEEMQHKLYIAGLLHDLGKVAIPDSILLKPGKLSEYEYEIMKYHPEFSYEIIKDVEMFKDIALIVRQHHERCDGSGYPDGLKCEEIKLEGRILAIADVFDALTTSRPYREAFEVSKAIEIIKSMPLDKDIVSKIESCLKDIYIIENKPENISEKLSEIEKSRLDLFEKDTFTGLYRIKSLIGFIDKLLETKERFYLFMIDIKHLKKINYIFGYEKGNELISKIAKAIKEEKEAIYPSRVGANYFAFIFKSSNPIAMQQRLKEKLKNITVNDYHPEFLITFVPSENIKNGEEIIYLAEMQLESLKFAAIKKG